MSSLISCPLVLGCHAMWGMTISKGQKVYEFRNQRVHPGTYVLGITKNDDEFKKEFDAAKRAGCLLTTRAVKKWHNRFASKAVALIDIGQAIPVARMRNPPAYALKYKWAHSVTNVKKFVNNVAVNLQVTCNMFPVRVKESQKPKIMAAIESLDSMQTTIRSSKAARNRRKRKLKKKRKKFKK